MENCEKSITFTFYAFFLCSTAIEIIFLFQIPYYYFSLPLKCLKIVRILLGIINFLIELFFEVIKYAEYLIKKEEQSDVVSIKRRYGLTDKILIIIAFIISAFTLAYNFTGIVLNTKYLKKEDSSSLQHSLYVDSLLFLIENILILLCWLFFFIYWLFKIKGFIETQKLYKEKANNVDKAPPPGPQQQQVSSERELKNKNSNQ